VPTAPGLTVVPLFAGGAAGDGLGATVGTGVAEAAEVGCGAVLGCAVMDGFGTAVGSGSALGCGAAVGSTVVLPRWTGVARGEGEGCGAVVGWGVGVVAAAVPTMGVLALTRCGPGSNELSDKTNSVSTSASRGDTFTCIRAIPLPTSPLDTGPIRARIIPHSVTMRFRKPTRLTHRAC
jgi:hypothetical protein